MSCQHLNFETGAKVGRLFKEDNPEVITEYRLDLMVRCKDCGLPFEFVGLPGGHNPGFPTINYFDATELRCPIKPSTDPVEHAKILTNPPKQ
jgi:hypothetical protein